MTDDVLDACVKGCLECYEHRSVEVYKSFLLELAKAVHKKSLHSSKCVLILKSFACLFGYK